MGTFCITAKLAGLCPLWVISGHRSMPDQCLLYPQKRTLAERGMSALCQARTLCSAAIDRDLLGHVLSNFRQQVTRAVRLWHHRIPPKTIRSNITPALVHQP